MGGIALHGAEFEDVEGTLSTPHPPLGEQNGKAVVQHNGDPNGQQHRREQDQPQQ